MQVQQVCVGGVREHRLASGTMTSAIDKRPLAGPVAVGPLGLQGDEQADPSVHGGPSKAVYAYPSEHLPFWQTVRAQAGVAEWGAPVAPGLLGANLLLQGILETDLWIGDALVIGSGAGDEGCTLAVSEPRLPCSKFALAMGFAQAARLMVQSGFCGSYLAVRVPGTVRAGDPVRLEPGPREVGLRELFRSRARA